MKPAAVEDPHLKILSKTDFKAIKRYNDKYGKKDDELQSEDLQYRLQFLPKDRKVVVVEDAQKLRMHNHFEFNWHLGNKKALFYNMRQYYELKGENVFNYLPLTFHIVRGVDDKEYKNFFKFYKNREREIQK